MTCLMQFPSAPMDDTPPLVCVSSDRFSDPLPLKALFHNDLDQAQSRGRQNLIYLRDEARVGARWASGVLSIVARQSANLVADEGATAVIHDMATPGSPGARYDHTVNLLFSGFAGVGLAFDTGSHITAQGNWAWHAGAQLLSVQRLLARDLVGRVQFDDATGIYSLHATSGYVNDRLHFPFQRPVAPGGWGALFQGGVLWQPHEQLVLHAQVQDLGRLQWRALPQEAMQLSTETSHVDADGYLVYQPLVEGHNSQSRYTTTPVATWSVEGQWTVGPQWDVQAQVRKMDGFGQALPYTGLTWQNSAWQGALGWLWHERAASLRVGWGGWRIALAADRLDGSAHARQATVLWQGHW